MNFGSQTLSDKARCKTLKKSHYRILNNNQYEMMFQRTNSNESLILAQNQRWRRASDMQVERESFLREASRVASG
jgi:hypothetical protein